MTNSNLFNFIFIVLINSMMPASAMAKEAGPQAYQQLIDFIDCSEHNQDECSKHLPNKTGKDSHLLKTIAPHVVLSNEELEDFAQQKVQLDYCLENEFIDEQKKISTLSYLGLIGMVLVDDVNKLSYLAEQIEVSGKEFSISNQSAQNRQAQCSSLQNTIKTKWRIETLHYDFN
ncbi:hypothetical protein [Thalassomonas sp. M1454]|uniref:hypothetical protein n=1 Tax=Thalassomonas sp. M1454 TaxID=2594477 RepID=UPI00117D046C|nr:hypothetical protein [Thalassomonas sp. M1454]TRX58003.1 hypothetical protein FNN08_01040 [Thalassomonas sp. M1454]